MTARPLADQALDQATERLLSYGSSLQGDSRTAIRALLDALEAGLSGDLEHTYHLSSIDPGIGKSLSVATFLKLWKESGFSPASSVVIGLSRLQEIETYLAHAGLVHADIAVLTSDSEMNSYGVPEAQHGDARVMFTTQQMIESRTKDCNFADAREFHYQGNARVLRIWDESLIPAKALTLCLDDLALLAKPLRRTHTEFIKQVHAFQRGLWDLDTGAVVQVPIKIANSAPKRKVKNAELDAIIETLKRLGGREAILVDTGSDDLRLAGSAPSLPDDFAPVIILDASGRVRTTYRLWEERLGNLRRLPAAANDYGALRVHLWERKVGQRAFTDPATMEDVSTAIAEVINDDDEGEDWLVICYKDHSLDDTLRSKVKADAVGRLHILTWGQHHGTNAFAHCRNVVIVGQLTYDRASYHALASAVCGLQHDAGVANVIQAGEYQHHILQALTRASARRSANGIAGPCTAYVVASPGLRAPEMIAETFPGCTIVEWSPTGPQASGNAGRLIALLEECRMARKNEVTKKELREQLGIKAPNFSRLLKQKAVKAYMDRHHLHSSRLTIIGWVHFDPYAGGGGWMVDELEEEMGAQDSS